MASNSLALPPCLSVCLGAPLCPYFPLAGYVISVGTRRRTTEFTGPPSSRLCSRGVYCNWLFYGCTLKFIIPCIVDCGWTLVIRRRRISSSPSLAKFISHPLFHGRMISLWILFPMLSGDQKSFCGPSPVPLWDKLEMVCADSPNLNLITSELKFYHRKSVK